MRRAPAFGRAAEDTRELREFQERSLDFTGRVLIARFSRNSQSTGKNLAGLVRSRAQSQKLSVMEIGGDVFRMPDEQRFEVFFRRRKVADILALHGQRVAGKRILRFGGDRFL